MPHASLWVGFLFLCLLLLSHSSHLGDVGNGGGGGQIPELVLTGLPTSSLTPLAPPFPRSREVSVSWVTPSPALF